MDADEEEVGAAFFHLPCICVHLRLENCRQMPPELAHAIEVLQRTPAVLRALLGGLSDLWVMNNYGPNTFSPFDVVGHLIHAERTNWMPRARLILSPGAATPFPTFDRYAMYESSKGRTIGELLDNFASARATSLDELRALN